jgi:ABC-2 type transport system permease protein
MSRRLLSTIVRKDLVLYFKNPFFAYVTIVGLIAYAGIYYIMPREVNETLEIGIVAPNLPAAFASELREEGLILEEFATDQELRSVVAEGDLPVGVSFPDGLMASIASGSQPQVNLYFSADLPEEFRDLYPILIEEWVSLMAGQSLTIEAQEEVLGVDRAGQQVAPRNRMLPLLAVFILMIETLGLASLISTEIAAGTIKALLITPLRVEALFLGKTVTGTALAFGQSGILVAVTGGLSREPLIVLTALLLGSVMVTGIAFVIASVSRDLMSVMSRGIVVVILLAIPGMNVLLPGLSTDWIKILPSFYLVDSIHQVINYDAGWSAVGGEILALLGFTAAFIGLGILALRRRFR